MGDLRIDCGNLPWQIYGDYPCHFKQRCCKFGLCGGHSEQNFVRGDDVQTRPCLHIMCAACASSGDQIDLIRCKMCMEEGRFSSWLQAGSMANQQFPILEVSGVV